MRGRPSPPLPMWGQCGTDRRRSSAGSTHAGNTRGHGDTLGKSGHYRLLCYRPRSESIHFLSPIMQTDLSSTFLNCTVFVFCFASSSLCRREEQWASSSWLPRSGNNAASAAHRRQWWTSDSGWYYQTSLWQSTQDLQPARSGKHLRGGTQTNTIKGNSF